MNKCNHCELLGDPRECPGQLNSRVCVRSDPKSELHTPGIVAKLISFTVAATQHVAAGMPMASEEQKNARLAICRACEHFEDGGCRLCGCTMNIKAGWAGSACPLDPPKWTAIPDDQRA